MTPNNHHVTYLHSIRDNYVMAGKQLPEVELEKLCQHLKCYGDKLVILHALVDLYRSGGQKYFGEKPFSTVVESYGARDITRCVLADAFHAFTDPETLPKATVDEIQAVFGFVPKGFAFKYRDLIDEEATKRLQEFNQDHGLDTIQLADPEIEAFRQYANRFREAVTKWLASVIVTEAFDTLKHGRGRA